MPLNFQLQLYLYLLGLLLVLTLIWFFQLQRFFKYLEKHNPVVYKSFGCPDYQKLRSGSEILILKYIFTDSLHRNLLDENSLVKEDEDKKRRILRYFFLLYILYAGLLCLYIVFTTLT